MPTLGQQLRRCEEDVERFEGEVHSEEETEADEDLEENDDPDCDRDKDQREKEEKDENNNDGNNNNEEGQDRNEVKEDEDDDEDDDLNVRDDSNTQDNPAEGEDINRLRSAVGAQRWVTDQARQYEYEKGQEDEDEEPRVGNEEGEDDK